MHHGVICFLFTYGYARNAVRRAHVTAPNDGLRNGACGSATACEILRNGAWSPVSSFLNARD
eukprot:490824-Prymnesium_polylepis.1